MGAGAAPLSLLRDAVARRALSAEPDAALARAVAQLQAAAGESLQAAVFFGSRRTAAARANAYSAYDLFLVVAGYLPFYRALRSAGLTGKRPALLAAVSRWLPPTQLSIEVGGIHVKAAVLDRRAFERETSPRRRDHFTAGRLFQPARIVASRSEADRDAVLDGLVSAHAATWHWVRPWLPASFDADEYGQRALEVSMGWEIRPEPPGRAATLWAAQRDLQQPVFDALLEALADAGELRALDPALAAHGRGEEAVPPTPAGPGAIASVAEAGCPAPSRIAPAPTAAAARRWTVARSPGRTETLRLRVYFSRSIARATLRWAKHVVSFEGWLDYIVRKASRHTGQPIQLTERERRWPLLFLWGRVFRYLRDKNHRGASR